MPTQVTRPGASDAEKFILGVDFNNPNIQAMTEVGLIVSAEWCFPYGSFRVLTQVVPLRIDLIPEHAPLVPCFFPVTINVQPKPPPDPSGRKPEMAMMDVLTGPNPALVFRRVKDDPYYVGTEVYLSGLPYLREAM